MFPQWLLDERKDYKYGTEEYDQWETVCRHYLEKQVGHVWNTSELTEEFSIEGFLAPCCYGNRRSDNARITLLFTHSPRFYYGLTVS